MGELYTCKDVAERYRVQIITEIEMIRKGLFDAQLKEKILQAAK